MQLLLGQEKKFELNLQRWSCTCTERTAPAGVSCDGNGRERSQSSLISHWLARVAGAPFSNIHGNVYIYSLDMMHVVSD